MSKTPFARLALLGEQLERTSKRRDLKALLAELLQSLSVQEIPPAVRLTIGQVFPEWDGRVLNVSWKAVMAVVDALADASPATREEIATHCLFGAAEAGLGVEGVGRYLQEPTRCDPL